MIHTLQKIGLLTALLLAAINASAYDFMSDGLCYNILSEEDRTVEVTYKSSTFSDNESYVNGILSIPTKTLYGSTTYSVIAIGEYAFRYTGLTQVIIPNSVTKIDITAFESTGLTAFNVADDNLHYTSIEGVLYNKEVTQLVACPAHMTQVTIPTSVIEIGPRAFWDCSSLTQVTIPNSVTVIGTSAFWSCTSLTQVTIPNSVTNIGGSAFQYCSGLTQVTIPNSVTEIGQDAFYSCNSLTQVTIPNSVTNIGARAFSDCTSLTQVTIPNSVTDIKVGTFYGCTSLTQVTIGRSVTSIGKSAFIKCDALTTIYCFPTTPPAVSDSLVDSNTLKNIILYVPTGCKAAYEAVDLWRDFGNIQEFDAAAGIKDVTDGDSGLKIAVCDGNLTIEGGEASAAIEIYSASGQLLSRSFERSVSGLPKGIYLVRVGNQTSKIAL